LQENTVIFTRKAVKFLKSAMFQVCISNSFNHSI
jgi:hypothetical protein